MKYYLLTIMMIIKMGQSISNKIINIDTCSICLDNINTSGKNIMKLQCNHYYHKKCIDMWLTDKDTCPYCIQVTNYNPNNNLKNVSNVAITECVTKSHLNKVSIAISIFLPIVFVLGFLNIFTIIIAGANIRNNYVETNNISGCTENEQGEINIMIIPDFFIQTIYIFIMIMSCTHFQRHKKSTYIAITVTTFVGIYSFSLYRYITFMNYLNHMSTITYCTDITNKINSDKMLIMIDSVLYTIFVVIYNLLCFFYKWYNK
jgi:hypothetical protein